MHDHPDNVQVLLTDTNAQVTTADGKVTHFSGKSGETQWRTARDTRSRMMATKNTRGFLLRSRVQYRRRNNVKSPRLPTLCRFSERGVPGLLDVL